MKRAALILVAAALVAAVPAQSQTATCPLEPVYLTKDPVVKSPVPGTTAPLEPIYLPK